MKFCTHCNRPLADDKMICPNCGQPTQPAPNKVQKKKPLGPRWIVGACLASCVFVYGFHISSLFCLCAAFVMLPFPFMIKFQSKYDISPALVVVLSGVLLFVGILAGPTASTRQPAEDTSQATIEEVTDENHDTTAPETTDAEDTTADIATTEKPDNSASTEEKIQMVWVAESGLKYHSRSTCSNMKSPRQIPLEDAKDQGYTACQKCH